MFKQLFLLTSLLFFLDNLLSIQAEANTKPDVSTFISSSDIQSSFQPPQIYAYICVAIFCLISMITILMMIKDLIQNDYFYDLCKSSKSLNDLKQATSINDNLSISAQNSRQNSITNDINISEGKVVIKV